MPDFKDECDNFGIEYFEPFNRTQNIESAFWLTAEAAHTSELRPHSGEKSLHVIEETRHLNQPENTVFTPLVTTGTTRQALRFAMEDTTVGNSRDLLAA